MSAPIILRQRSGPIISIVVWVFLAFLLGDALVRGAWDTVGRFGPALLLIGWLAFAVLWRPALIVDNTSVTVRDPLRTTTMPFARIRDIRLGASVAIEATTADGRHQTLRPWNAPGMPRRKTDSGLTGGSAPESVDAHPCIELLRRWEHDRAQARDEHLRHGAAATGAVADSATANSVAGPAATNAETHEVVTRWNFGVLTVSLILFLLILINWL